MSAIKINIILFGIGNVGSTLINQILESQAFFYGKSKISLRFPVITNSALAFFEKGNLSNTWQAGFAKSAIPFRAEDIINYSNSEQLENVIVVDATASYELIKSYIPIHPERISYCFSQ